MNRGGGGKDSVGVERPRNITAQSSTDNRSGYVVHLAGNIYDLPLPDCSLRGVILKAPVLDR